MPKKEWTAEERKAFGDKMRALKQQKANLKETPLQGPVASPAGPQVIIGHEEYADLKRQVEELKSMLWKQPSESSGVALKGGRLVGTVTKYDLTPAKYPDPTERLRREPRLSRFAFDLNYDLNFSISVSEYTTLDGIHTKEPKFTVELVGKVFDEETGELTNGRYIISRLIMHEDPEAALMIARDNNIDVEAEDEESFLNEMRYIRMRDWLITCFFPEKPKNVRGKKDMVVGGKIVEFYEVTTEEDESVKIPFGEIANRKM